MGKIIHVLFPFYVVERNGAGRVHVSLHGMARSRDSGATKFNGVPSPGDENGWGTSLGTYYCSLQVSHQTSSFVSSIHTQKDKGSVKSIRIPLKQEIKQWAILF